MKGIGVWTATKGKGLDRNNHAWIHYVSITSATCVAQEIPKKSGTPSLVIPSLTGRSLARAVAIAPLIYG